MAFEKGVNKQLIYGSCLYQLLLLWFSLVLVQLGRTIFALQVQIQEDSLCRFSNASLKHFAIYNMYIDAKHRIEHESVTIQPLEVLMVSMTKLLSSSDLLWNSILNACMKTPTTTYEI